MLSVLAAMSSNPWMVSQIAPASKLWVLGDIHGCLPALKRLWQQLQPTLNDHVVCLGDYIDRGSDSKGVIDFLIAAQTQTQLTCLMGNHEQMLLDCGTDAELWAYWCRYGGQQTLASYGYTDAPVERGLDFLPAAHVTFFKSLHPYAEHEHYLFSHACPVMHKPLSDHTIKELRWRHIMSDEAHVSGKRAIFGHVSQYSGLVYQSGPHVGIDTSVSGWISALEPDTGQVHQADRSGDYRSYLLD
ncbi:MAG: Serine/threonine-protein phosphatase 1 [Pseudomonadota bacterium]|jgi:serine/threonine protein phosphatase 1